VLYELSLFPMQFTIAAQKE